MYICTAPRRGEAGRAFYAPWSFAAVGGGQHHALQLLGGGAQVLAVLLQKADFSLGDRRLQAQAAKFTVGGFFLKEGLRHKAYAQLTFYHGKNLIGGGGFNVRFQQ